MHRFLPLLLIAAAIGCQPPENLESDAAGDGDEVLQIAVIPKGTTHEFWKSVHYGAEQAAQELGDVEILWKGSQEESDRDGQITVMQNFVTRQVDGICLAPLDSQALVAPVDDAVRSGIPVVIFDSALDDASQIVSYVATDNRAGGRLAAETLAASLGGKGKVVLLRYTPGSASTHQREEGFLEKLKEHPGIEVISSDQYAGTTPESSLDRAQQVLNTHRDEIDGIFAVCEPNAMGTLTALENLSLAGKVKFVGFDPNPRMVAALSEKKMQGIVLQDPVKMGYTAVKTLVQKIRGQDVDQEISTGEYVATPENMGESRMRELLNPPQYGE